ncbi:uncharacterized protein A1O5_12048 [Cladophialophora psammophila CBS 110553]|uniref:Uncharacterized protein n=1 Tax=Cladophialophora psammophila CBS 110553 TaxID=1182543 RepID=W9W9P9_9EURO|nr:uncharacterized protein A1O5_12048 [Cladophialophora psammophila CBS 110553]EXJ61256.1 hypothetical protein A1O5_12048 [Cladophialophora psammophila CBS 110553]
MFISFATANTPSRAYITGAVLANLPHLGLSVLYLAYNNLFTRIFIALEFRSLSTQRRGLRASMLKEEMDQRSTYFVQFPLRYSLAVIGFFVLLHTLLSETLFLQRTYAVWPGRFDEPKDIGKFLVSKIGVSPLATLAFSLVLSVLVVSSIAIAFWKVD